MGQYTEAALIQKAANGDRDAFEKLFEGERLEAVYAYIRSRVRDRELAKDVLSESMLAVWQGLGAFSGGARFTTWCISIARRKLADHYRRSYTGEKNERPLEAAENLSAETDDFERVDSKLAANTLLKTLSAKERQLVELVFNAQMSYQEAADELEIPVGTVKSRMSAIRAKLRKAGGLL
jgi:RNA polymerase sigma-70 factor, ECF subfamily